MLGDDNNNRGDGSDGGEFYHYRYQLSFIDHLLYARHCNELLTNNTSLFFHEV